MERAKASLQKTVARGFEQSLGHRERHQKLHAIFDWPSNRLSVIIQKMMATCDHWNVHRIWHHVSKPRFQSPGQ